MQHIVIVGGGAGGLELATKLGHKLGKRNKAKVTLIDRSRVHIWKPLLHEVATGTLDTEIDGVVYQAHAAKHHFNFQLGTMCGLDQGKQEIILSELNDERHLVVLPERRVQYDKLVLAVGSMSNDFGTPGVAEHCYMLDSKEQAQRFQKHLLNHFLQSAQTQPEQGKPFNLAIVGAGATGVELSAELHHVIELLPMYDKLGSNTPKLNIDLIEAGPRILPALPERIANAAANELIKLGVSIHTKTRIVNADEQAFTDDQGNVLTADMKVWAAGVKVPDWVKELGLEINRINQIVCQPSLQTVTNSAIYAIGDCCAINDDNGNSIPPRAQSAHQMADAVAKNLIRELEHKPLLDFKYRDYGSLINLSRFSTVGSLMGNLMRGSLFVEGMIARMMYLFLYRMHQLAIHGYIKGPLVILLSKLSKAIRPKMKLH